MSKRLSILVGLVVLSTSLSFTAGAAGRPLTPPWIPETPYSSETAMVTIDGHAVDAEIADTGELRERGLSYRNGLAHDTGMLFVYTDASVRSFWMFEMRFCLDIIWITDGRLVGAAENSCPAKAVDEEIPRFRSPVAVQYVLEVDGGWMAAHDVTVGAEVAIELPPSVTRTPLKRVSEVQPRGLPIRAGAG